MNFDLLIEKTIRNEKGYKYHTYYTEFDKDKKIFSLYHYGTKILELDIQNQKVISYYIYSVSDKIAITRTFWTLSFNFKIFEGYYVYRNQIFMDKDNNDVLIKEDGTYYEIYKCKIFYRNKNLFVAIDKQNKKVFAFLLKNAEDVDIYKKKRFIKLYLGLNNNINYITHLKDYGTAEIKMLDNDNLLNYTNNLKEIIQKAKIKSIVEAL